MFGGALDARLAHIDDALAAMHDTLQAHADDIAQVQVTVADALQAHAAAQAAALEAHAVAQAQAQAAALEAHTAAMQVMLQAHTAAMQAMLQAHAAAPGHAHGGLHGAELQAAVDAAVAAAVPAAVAAVAPAAALAEARIAAQLDTRAANAHLHPGQLVAPVLVRGELPAHWPAGGITLAQLHELPGQLLNSLLADYGLPVQGIKRQDRLSALMRRLGVL